MNVLIIGQFHHKNTDGLIRILQHLGYNFSWGCENDIDNYDVIFSPLNPIDTSKYPNKKFIFGPHFSVFPDDKLSLIKNVNNNAVYIQPSEQAANVWKILGAEKYIPIKVFPFPVNTEKFNNPDMIFIYYKRRHPSELIQVINFIKDKNVEYRIFDYLKGYEENEYIAYLQKCKYGIIIDAHESQGFAIQEALSCNVPLLVWSTKTMKQEFNGYDYTYKDFKCNLDMVTVPYWDNRCGEVFYESSKLETTYNLFISKLNTYKPREFIIETLSVKPCAQKFVELVKFY